MSTDRRLQELKRKAASGDREAAWELALGLLNQAKELGCRLAIDDFGTGYSSLSYLHRFPVDTLKIDQCFVRDMETDPDDAAIVRAVLNLAHSLGIRTVAEGVENAQQLAYLRAGGCHYGQGYLFGAAMPAVGVEQLLMSPEGISRQA